MPFEYFIGGRYLRTKQKQTFIFLITLLSVAGVTVGVMSLIVVIAVMSGFDSDIKNRILGVDAHVVLKRHGVFFDYQSIARQVEEIDEVQAAMPFVDGQSMLRSLSRTSGAVVKGVDPDKAGSISPKIPVHVLKKKNHLSQDHQRIPIPGIILGKELAENLGVAKGDRVYVISPRGTVSPVGFLPAMKPFKLVETFSTGVYEYDGSLAFIHLFDAQKIFQMKHAVTGVDIRVRDVYRAKECADRIIRMLGPDYFATDWMERNQNLFSALKLERFAMFIILALIILVAAFNISSTLIMMVMEKTKDIAILKAMGATNNSIKKIFIFKGMAVGLVGVTLGTAMGCLLCALLGRYKFIELPEDVFYIATLPVQLEVFDVFFIGFSAVMICFLATLYPARKASRLNPIEAIRYG